METNIDPLCSKKVGQTNKGVVSFRHILASKNPIDRTNHPPLDIKVDMTFVSTDSEAPIDNVLSRNRIFKRNIIVISG